jgi:CheY-like chemotaxis protein
MPIMNGNIATSEIRKIEKEISDRKCKRSKRLFGYPIPILFPQPCKNRPYQINQASEGRSLIFALTGLASEEDKLLAFESGVDDFLTKPVSLKLLEKALKRWADEKEREKEIGNVLIAGEEDMKGQREKRKKDYRVVCVVG